MMVRRLLCAAVVLTGVLAVTAGLAAAGAVSWGKAVEVPGTAGLNFGGNAVVNSVACASAKNCAAGGYYYDAGHHQREFVAREKSGVWGSAVNVPGLAVLNFGNYAAVNSVSCGAVGNCSAGGFYLDQNGHQQAFVVNQKNAVWGNAKEVSLPNINNAQLLSMSCRSAGNCSAGGYYTDNVGRQAFVVSEKNGVWGSGIEVPGTATLNTYFAQTLSVSCASAGNCVAGGYYHDGANNQQAFVVSEKKNVWGNAIELPGSAALNVTEAQVSSASCTTAGNCSVGGYYTDVDGGTYPFVATEKAGKWGNAANIKGMAALNLYPRAQVNSVSCVANMASPSNCAAGGFYYDGAGFEHAFVVSEKSGIWGSAKTLVLPNPGNALVTSISCAAAGVCAAGGYYPGAGPGYNQAFVASEKNWVWAAAVEVPGTAALNASGAGVSSVSCVAAGRCALGGYYHDVSNAQQVFVTSP